MNAANGTERRDFPATWRPTERAYRTRDLVVHSTWAQPGSPCQDVPDARPRNKFSSINALSGDSEVHHRETCGFHLPDGAYVCKPTNRPSSELLMVRMSTKKNTRIHRNLHLHRSQNSPYLVSPRAAANSKTRREKTRLASSATRRRRYTLSVCLSALGIITNMLVK